MGFASEEQGAPKTAFEVRLKCRDRLGVEDAKPRGAAAEAVEFGSVAGRRHHQRAVAHDVAGQGGRPPVGGMSSERKHSFLGALALAPWGQHAAGLP